MLSVRERHQQLFLAQMASMYVFDSNTCTIVWMIKNGDV